MSDTLNETVAPARIGDCLQRAWNALKLNIWSFIGFTLLFYFALAVVQYVLGYVPYGKQLANLISFIYPVSIYSAFKAADGGAEIGFQDFLSWQPRFGRLLLGSIVLYAIIMAFFIPVAIIFGLSIDASNVYQWNQLTGLGWGLIGFGTLFLLLYGILSMAFHFLLLKRDYSLGESLRLSARVGLKHFGPIILFGLLAVGLVILGAVACGLGLLVTFPLIFGTQYFFLLSIFPDAENRLWDFDETTPPSEPYRLS